MNIGFIGLGKMGQAIAARLVHAGHRVRVWNRSAGPVKELVERGAEAAARPAETARGELLVSMLADDAAMRAVLLDKGVLEAAAPGLIHLNLATISVALARELTELHRRYEVSYVAAPVFGRPEVAAEGKLNIVVAGEPAAIERAKPALSAIGQKIWPVGERPEAASAVKIAGNFMIASAIEAMGEAAALARAHGIGAKEFMEIVTGSLFAAPVYKGYGALIAEERYQPAGFAVTLGLKDIRLALAAGDAAHVPMPFAALLRDNLLELIATGSAGLDWACLAGLAAQRAGLEHRGS
ncbi:MAG TPA: NAD(P)-dependent oxidoreductase [Steroidobacteraceae bacterium]|nr:NAD(P)-dependent oxidoreductase [Steroidobacteraceae bacterium]